MNNLRCLVSDPAYNVRLEGGQSACRAQMSKGNILLESRLSSMAEDISVLYASDFSKSCVKEEAKYFPEWDC